MADLAERTRAKRNFAKSLKPWGNTGGKSAELQNAAAARALDRALAHIGFRAGYHVVDFGCGNGASLQPFLDRGCAPETLGGTDIDADEIADGRRIRPGVDFRTISDVPFPTDSADLVFASTVFYEIQADAIGPLATEMRRVVKPGGYIIVRDWTMPRPGARTVTRRRIEQWFGLAVALAERGAMMQPVGRAFSAFLPGLYWRVEPWCPFGMKVYVLKA